MCSSLRWSPRLFAIALLVAFPAIGLGQNSSAAREERVESPRDRIATLARTLRADVGLRPDDVERQLSTATRAAGQVEREVDRYVSTLDATKVDANAVLVGLKDVLMPLGDFTEESLFVSIWRPDSVPPQVHCNSSGSSQRNAQLLSQRSLIVALGIYKGFNESSVTLRAYRAANGHFALVDVPGRDFEHNAELSTRPGVLSTLTT
jgi:hypothetical protein